MCQLLSSNQILGIDQFAWIASKWILQAREEGGVERGGDRNLLIQDIAAQISKLQCHLNKISNGKAKAISDVGSRLLLSLVAFLRMDAAQVGTAGGATGESSTRAGVVGEVVLEFLAHFRNSSDPPSLVLERMNRVVKELRASGR
jgi:hypothetical protein